jgi:transposase
VQQRLDENSQAMRLRRERSSTLKMRMGATHFLMKRLPKVATEMAGPARARLQSHAGMNIAGVKPLMAAIRT